MHQERGDGATLESGGSHQNNHHEPSKYFSSETLKITLVFAVVAVTCLILNQSSYPIEFFRNSSSFLSSKDSGALFPLSCENASASSPFHHNTSQNLPLSVDEEETVELEKTLRKAVMDDNRTVIITILNKAWTPPNSIFDLFLESFRIGNGTAELLNHVMVAAFDQTAYERCTAEGLHCYAVRTEGVDFSGEQIFMRGNYLKMMWRRTAFLGTVLQLGFDFVFTDADVMWLRNPFTRFYPDGDFQIACDHYWANYTDRNNSPNGGFKYVKSNNRTIHFYNLWHHAGAYYPGRNEQDVLNYIKFLPFVDATGLQMRFLDTADFSGFCEPAKDLDRVVTMHANCCIGIDNKVHDLKMVIDDWKRYVSSLSSPRDDAKNSTSVTWTLPRYCY